MTGKRRDGDRAAAVSESAKGELRRQLAHPYITNQRLDGEIDAGDGARSGEDGGPHESKKRPSETG